MATNTTQASRWFCGGGAAATPDIRTQAVDYLNDSCILNGLYCVPHIAFALLAVGILLYKRFSNSSVAPLYSSTAGPLLRLRYPFHDARWLLLLALVLMAFFQIGEGILTSMLVLEEGVINPQLFIPGVLAVLATIVSMAYYNYAELWDRPVMMTLQVVYWLLAIINEKVRFHDLRRNPAVNLLVLKYDITLIMLIIYIMFLIIDVYLLINRVIFCNKLALSTYGGPTFAMDSLSPNVKYRHSYSSYSSSVSLWWMNALFRLGYKRPLEESDLGELPTEFKAHVTTDNLQEEISKEFMKKNSVEIEDVSFTKIYLRLHGAQIALAGFQKLASNFLQLAGPLILQKVIDQITTLFIKEVQAVKKDAGYITVVDAIENVFTLVIILFLMTFLSTVFNQRHAHNMLHVGTKVRSALQGSVYLKALRLSPTSLGTSDMSAGRIANHIGTDPNNMQQFFAMVHMLWTSPIQVILMLVLLYTIIGLSALIGASCFLLAMVFQGIITKFLGKSTTKVMVHADSRLKKTNELLQGIKLVKLNGWEDKFRDRINESRTSEIGALYRIAGLASMMLPLALLSMSLAIVCAFGVYYPIEKKVLTPTTLFPALALLQSLAGPLMILPACIMATVNALISHKRLIKFLSAPEVKDEVISRVSITSLSAKDACHSGAHQHEELMKRLKNTKTTKGDNYGTFGAVLSAEPELEPELELEPTELPDGVAMKIDHGTFTWEEPSRPTLTDIDIEIQEGKLTGIVGEVGSGKSSLISALLGEMKIVSGRVIWNSDRQSIAYASQKAWLINATLRDNILFYEPYDDQRYNTVIDICGLRPDIDMLPAGDRTEIGEKGINLSGGQKQRVSVARAIYSHSEIVILDDPMSALDTHVGAHVFKEAVKKFLTEEERTVILVTHQTQYLPDVNYVIVLKSGAVWRQGTPDEIHSVDPALYESWVAAAKKTKDEEAAIAASEKDQEIDKEIKVLREQIKEREKEMQFRLTRTSSFLEEEEPFEDPVGLVEEDDGSVLIKAEERNTGSVSWQVYLYYLKAAGPKLVLVVMFLFTCSFILSTFISFWLSDWSEAGLAPNLTVTQIQDLTHHYLVGYFLMSMAQALFSYLASAFTYYSSLRAGKKIHSVVLKTIVQSPMRFFDTTPVGRILNRFSVDTRMVDQTIGGTASLLFQFAMATICGLFINVIAAPIFIVGLVPMIILYWFIVSYYITTTRELKRLESVSLSPVYSHFSETITGLSTVRAYNKQACFAGIAMEKINASSLTMLYRTSSNFWLQFRLGFVGATVIMLSGTAVITSFFLGNIDPSLVGLAMTVIMFSTQQLMALVNQSAELEMQMNAIERLQYFAELPTEMQEGVFDPPDDWPFMGDITMRNIEMRYAKELEPVLQNISLRIKGGEKVGICGRTGSGKSSLMLAFFRVIEKTMGNIYIDGVNIDHVPLAVLRQRLSIVPQDPTLFTGTVRFNLDPFNKCTDDEVWDALSIAQLKATVANLPQGIDSLVTEGGENFSVGQRQLFCLARAFLRKSRILIMDEATASIDKEMDAVLQKVLFSAFADKTVLTIAHRVSTILNYDTTVVLSDGKLAEWDTPQALLSKKDSIFSSLVNKDKELD